MPVTLRKAAKELPSLTSFTAWDSVELVKAAINALETTGYLDKAAQVVDAMGRDDRISGVMLTRAGALPALPLTMSPRGDKRQAQMVAREAQEGFEQWFPDHALTELAHWGTMLGVGLGQLIWKFGENRWTVDGMKVWHPRFLRYDYNAEAWEVTTTEGPMRVTPGDGQWVLYTPYGETRGWMYSKVRSLHVPWLLRQWGLRDWARYAEVLGNPMKLAHIPSGAPNDEKERFIVEVANIGAEAVVALPRVSGGMEGDQFGLELLEAQSNSWQTFQQLIDKADSCIAISLLGQNLTTEVKGGSYAAAVMHTMIRNDVLQSDAEKLGQCLRDQALKPWAAYNFGDAELAPMPTWRTKPSEEKVARGTGMKALGEGILALQQIGAKPDVDALLDDDSIPVSEKAGDPLPLPTAKPNAGDAPGPTSQKLPRPTQKAAAASSISADALLLKLRQMSDSAKHLVAANPDLPAAAIEGQAYVDDVATETGMAATKAVAPDLADVVAVIDSAKDFTDLRQRLIALYGRMSKTKLARLLEQAFVMADLAGRHAVLEELADQVKRGED